MLFRSLVRAARRRFAGGVLLRSRHQQLPGGRHRHEDDTHYPLLLQREQLFRLILTSKYILDFNYTGEAHKCHSQQTGGNQSYRSSLHAFRYVYQAHLFA